MIVSVVSGTYNRLNYMQQMVRSVRQSVGGRIPYEIVLVDGGSTDGTLEWCGEQEDIQIIEQGELLGAVKAFNAGANAARGKYVILANDDIVFVGTSILRAIAFMEDHPKTGVGCFYQDRDGKPWHVETMPAVKDGKQGMAYYGQVCIVPKELGDVVGWWGDYLHTYGGDNELSANILELGFKVTPIKCACIHDLQAQDNLRTINKGNPAAMARSGRPHPDTIRWHQRWSRNGMVGPVIEDQGISYRSRQQRFLYAPIYERGHDIQKSTKVGLFNALSEQGLVYEHDYMSLGVRHLLEVAEDFQPDVMVLQIQDPKTITIGTMRELREACPTSKIVTWNGDYHPDNLYDIQYARLLSYADHAGFALASDEFREHCERHNVPWFYWQIGWEEAVAKPVPDTPKHDVVFLANGYSVQRHALAKYLASLRSEGIDVGIYGSWPAAIGSNGQNLYDFDAGARIYRNAKIAISDQQWPEAEGYVSNRLFQAMAAGGCVVLQENFYGMEKWLGLKPLRHVVTWVNIIDLGHKIERLLKDEQLRKKISKAGTRYMRKNHSFQKRVEELLDVIG